MTRIDELEAALRALTVEEKTEKERGKEATEHAKIEVAVKVGRAVTEYAKKRDAKREEAVKERQQVFDRAERAYRNAIRQAESARLQARSNADVAYKADVERFNRACTEACMPLEEELTETKADLDQQQADFCLRVTNEYIGRRAPIEAELRELLKPSDAKEAV